MPRKEAPMQHPSKLEVAQRVFHAGKIQPDALTLTDQGKLQAVFLKENELFSYARTVLRDAFVLSGYNISIEGEVYFDGHVAVRFDFSE